MVQIAILIGGKGRGSNMKTLVLSCSDAQISVVVSPKENDATEWARQKGIHVEIIPKQENYSELLLALMTNIDIICLAGYVYLLPQDVIQNFKGKILNIHPSLLPKYGGKGMYGMAVHQAVFDAKEPESGCTVHYVSEDYDDGDILIQKMCKIDADDTPESIAAKVLELEHIAYPEAVNRLIYELKQDFYL